MFDICTEAWMGIIPGSGGTSLTWPVSNVSANRGKKTFLFGKVVILTDQEIPLSIASPIEVKVLNLLFTV